MYTLDLDDLIRHALKEDIHTGDLTTRACLAGPRPAEARFVAKESFVLAGIQVAARVFTLLDPAVVFDAQMKDGARVTPGDLLDRKSVV